jgi:DnaJ-class molecular chaperone
METTTPEIVICPECEGNGEVRVGNLREMHNCDTEPCGQCAGKGRLIKTVTIKYEKLC